MLELQPLEQPTDSTPVSTESALDMNHLTEALLFLTELRQDDSISYNRADIDSRQTRISEAKDQELYEWMNESDQTQWQTHPSFYYALIAELRSRKLITTGQI